MNCRAMCAALLCLTGAPAFLATADAAVAAETAAKPYYTVAGSKIGLLLDNPATKAILLKYIPTVIDNPRIQEARSLTLSELQPWSAGKITKADLAKIDAELAKVPRP